MYDNTNELITDAEIMDEHVWGRDTSPYGYNQYVRTPLFIILDTYITELKNWFHLIKTTWEITSTNKYILFSNLNPYSNGYEFSKWPNLLLHLIHNIKLTTFHTMVKSTPKRQQ